MKFHLNEHGGSGGCEGHDWNIGKAIAESSKTSILLSKVMSPFLRCKGAR